MRTREQRLLNLVQRPGVYEEVLVESADTPIALSVWRAERDAPCVVFLPGTMTHPLFYEEFLDGVAKAGFSVVGVHLQGHGKSPRTSRSFTFEDLVQNGVTAVSYAIERFGTSVLVMDSSQGGNLAMAVAGRDPRIAAVFAHNVMDTSLAQSLCVTRFPEWLQSFYGAIPEAMNALSKLLPGMPLPLHLYLDERPIFGEPWTRKQFYSDPLGLTSYPLCFVASLFSADTSFLTCGQVRCPVIIIASTGDKLFPLDYIRKVYGRIVAPRKEMLVDECRRHLIFNECVGEILPELVPKLKEYARSNINGNGNP